MQIYVLKSGFEKIFIYCLANVISYFPDIK